MDAGLASILQCPNTGSGLLHAGNELTSQNGEFRYAFLDGICHLLPGAPQSMSAAPASAGPRDVREYYEKEGWEADAGGQFGDTKAFVDTRSAPMDYTRKCMRRLRKYFQQGGQYILDAGCGAIPHNEYIEYGNAYTKRVCVDFSGAALKAARAKLGDRGYYIQGDLTNLPLKDNSVDAVTCNHVLYHVPAESQARVLTEFWRVLKPGGVALVVYAWNWSPIAYRLRKAAALLVGEGKTVVNDATPDLYFHPHSLQWFETQPWPFECRLDTFRLVDNGFMQRYIGDGAVGRAMLGLFYGLQQVAPGFCGRYGLYPAIVIRK